MTPKVSDLNPDPTVSIRSDGLLDPFHRAGVLSTTDVQIATALLRISRRRTPADPLDDELVRLAAAVTVRGLRHGSVTVDLTTAAGESVTEDGIEVPDLPWPDVPEWLAALQRHPLVARSPEDSADDSTRPLVLADDRLYLQKYRSLETSVRDALVARCRPVAGVPTDPALLTDVFPGDQPNRQRLAAAAALSTRLTILAGGPGTGKTTTIAGIIAALRRSDGPDVSLGLAAPTGKAAARMQSAANEALAALPGDQKPITAVTLHRLLGWRPDPARPFRHDRDHPLPHDVVIVDETSMVDLAMMHSLLSAVRPDARLILVGDPGQLASIDVGAVLEDVVAVAGPAPHAENVSALAPNEDPTLITGCGTVTLTETWRFRGAIAELAVAIDSGDADAVLTVLRSGSADVQFTDSATVGATTAEELRTEIGEWAAAVDECAAGADAVGALAALDRYRVLCAHRHGPAGVSHWNTVIRSWLPNRRAAGTSWEIGQGVIVTANDYALGVHNGDAGVVVAGPDGDPLVAFARPDAPLLIPPVRLDAVMALDAMTVHRAQGSQFENVTVVLPDPDSRLLTRELLYTAVTRARHRVRVVGSEASVRAAVGRRVSRASQLTRRLTEALAAERDQSSDS